MEIEVNLGSIELNHILFAGDPCYGYKSVWLYRLNVKPGKYLVQATIENNEITQVMIKHKDHLDVKARVIGEYLGVDSGTLSFCSDEFYRETHTDDTTKKEWWDKVIEETTSKTSKGYIIGNDHILFSTLYGDGEYVCYTGENSDGEIVSLRIDNTGAK